MAAEGENQRALDIWMDGNCTVCRSSRVWCERHDPKERLRFVDFRALSDGDLPVARADLESSMWVRDATGNLTEGFTAWRLIMAEIPGWRWLAKLASVPPLSLVGPHVYRFIAAHRHRLVSR